MNYLSVCSGIEAATVAWHDLGFNPTGFSEIEPFPAAALQHHYPDVTNFGDMTKFKEWNLDPSGVDLLVGGTPCQSFSVAGLRKGLDDPRGNLALTYCAMLDHFRPKWFVWENVPGVLSSNGGRDFGSFLGAVAELGYGFAYRVLDAQYFGVAQRRRRVFVVGHLGGWQRPAAVLFERESLRRDTAPSREAREEASGCTTQCFDRQSSGEYGRAPVASTMSARDYKSAADLVAQPTYSVCCGSDPIHAKELAQPITRRNGDPGTIAQSIAFGVGETPDTAHCLRSGASRADKHESTTYVAQQMPVAQPIAFQSSQSGVRISDTHATLDANNGPRRHNGAVVGMAVRRLTPVECERLQGFPDNYTNIPWRKSSESPDGPRYKALGNSMAVPVMRWIGERIKQVESIV